jgi:hypothetical protein
MISKFLSVFILSVVLSACGAGGSSPSAPASLTAPPYEPVPIVQPKQLCIYYGQPDKVNKTTPVYYRDETGTVYDIQVTDAVSVFSNCALVVLGDGLEIVSNPAYYNTQLIIYGLSEKNIPIFGYVDAGVATQNLSLAEAQARIDAWNLMGVNGVFLDDFGFDYGTSRSRQNALVDYVHAKKLQAFVNAYNPDDVFADKNEQGVTQLPSIAEEDFYLVENWLYAEGRPINIDDWMTKTLKLATYLQRYPVHIAATATTAATQATQFDNQRNAWQYAYWGAVLQNAEYFQWTDNSFSSDDDQLYTFGTPANFPFNQSFTSDIAESVVSGNVKNYKRTHTNGAISIYGDGASVMGVTVGN